MKLEPPYFEGFTWEGCFTSNNDVRPVLKYCINSAENSYYCQECLGVIKLSKKIEELSRDCPFVIVFQ